MNDSSECNYALRTLCFQKVRELYGDRPTEIVTKRLSRELNLIIRKGYAPIFLLMQKLVQKSASDGCSVMPRYALGASFVAYLLGIAEGNPLPPHYHCTSCFYADFGSASVQCGAGFDLLDKICPCCGMPMKKDGLDIPFETFMGLDGEKDAEFALNFSGEYLSQIKKYADTLPDRSRFPQVEMLGYSTPTFLRELQALTGIDPAQIPFDDPKVLSLFSSPEALDVPSEKLPGWEPGTDGIPLFDGRYVKKLLSAIRPKRFSDLIRVLGMALGAGTWKDNADELLKHHVCSISCAICCKDDIWNELRYRGVPEDTAFSIMENVGSGCVAAGQCASWENWKQVLTAYGLPTWYIRSCEKIRYLPVKAHCAAYVIAAWKLAFFKLYYPLEFYTAYLNIVADRIFPEQVYQGETAFHAYYAQFFPQQAVRSSIFVNLQVVCELYARGFAFLPPDKEMADTDRYRIVEGKIMPPLALSDLLHHAPGRERI